jgi:uncharacterized protein (TIGR03437 family)
MKRCVTLWGILIGVPIWAQPLAIASGRVFPEITLAPGEVVTLYVTEIPGGRHVKAETAPLPRQLAGITVTFVEVTLSEPERFIPAPLFSIEPVPGQPALTAVTIQVPYELHATPIACPIACGYTSLRVANNGVPGDAIFVGVKETNVRIWTICAPVQSQGATSYSCRPAITHADGSLLSLNSPARLGETLVVYAVGLGRPPSVITTGDIAHVPVPFDKSQWSIDFNFGANLPPRRYSSLSSPKPEYIGLVQGFIGLAQVNVRLPDAIPEGTPRCTNPILDPMFVASTNLTISLQGPGSFDGAAICVE